MERWNITLDQEKMRLQPSLASLNAAKKLLTNLQMLFHLYGPGAPAAVPWISCLPRPADGPTIQSYSLQTQSPALKPAWHVHVWLYCCTGLVAHRDVASRCSVSLISAILSLGRQTGHEEKVGRRESSKAPPACSAHQHHVFPFCCKICNEYLPGFVVGTANQQNMQIPLFQVIFFILLHL